MQRSGCPRQRAAREGEAARRRAHDCSDEGSRSRSRWKPKSKSKPKSKDEHLSTATGVVDVGGGELEQRLTRLELTFGGLQRARKGNRVGR
jgi:hypothetical protein